MSFYEWGDQLDVRVAAMNEQHKRIIALMNRLHASARTNAPQLVIESDLAELGRFTTQHFADEEAYMKRIGFAKLITHAEIHRRLLQKFTSFVDQYRTTGQLGADFFDFLKMWLSAHIQGVDVQYGEPAAKVAAR